LQTKQEESVEALKVKRPQAMKLATTAVDDEFFGGLGNKTSCTAAVPLKRLLSKERRKALP